MNRKKYKQKFFPSTRTSLKNNAKKEMKRKFI